ncbi:hypothetical protein LZ554_004217 [Drepanopeziza brunnea f. sp. 'monogermtubi']|nr:hypothetical protein LZ554_004217 [Drepanopeziza brunnea f. sp. 'monogermtubi']
MEAVKDHVGLASGASSPTTSSSLSNTLTSMRSMGKWPSLSDGSLGDVLIIGGCGFLGHHIVRFCDKDPACTSVTVMCRSPFKNLQDGVNYLIGDITNIQHVRHVMRKVKPKTIINTASPHAYKDHESVPDIFRVNINGNQNLLLAAREIGTVKLYIYTSSAPIVASPGGGYDHADENAPTLAVPRLIRGDPYHIAKALADKIVLQANGKGGILTCTIRPTALYGEGDGQMVGPVIQALEDGYTGMWTGYNDAEMDVVYVGHVAIAHLLAAKGMLAEMSDPKAIKISGEAFNITDDEPHHPLDFFRMFWATAGHDRPFEEIIYIPPQIVMAMAHFAEWLVWATSKGKLRPKALLVERMEFVLYTRTYSIEKARSMLGFIPWKDQPYVNQIEAIKGSVAHYLLPENHGPVTTGAIPAWPETPFKLITSTGVLTDPSVPKGHHCVEAARFMVQTHNTIFRALNAIYAHSYNVRPVTSAASSLLSYCSTTYDFMHHHQLVEEHVYFPAIEAASTKSLMQENVSQHLLMEKGLEAFRRYAEVTRKENFSGEGLRRVINGFQEAYEKHQHEEIGTILALGKVIDSDVLKTIDMEMRSEAERQSDVFKQVLPSLLSFTTSNHILITIDSHFLIDGKIHAYPPLNPISRIFVPVFVSLFMYPRHSDAWEFAPSTLRGGRKPLPPPARNNNNNNNNNSGDGCDDDDGGCCFFADGAEVYMQGVKFGVPAFYTWVDTLQGSGAVQRLVLAIAALCLAYAMLR